jgi:hypothetical protein
LAGQVHLSRVGYAGNAPLVARIALKATGESVAGGVDGPQITNVSRLVAAVTVTITHDGGTDFTPTSSIGGFRFYDGTTSTEIAISAAVRTNATTITLTLGSTPVSANQKLRYVYDQLYNTDYSTLVIDNSANLLPLRGCEWNSTDTGASWTKLVTL